MSADNTIVVLGTTTEYKRELRWIQRVPKYKVYRVAHVQAWDNFEYYKENQLYNLGSYLWECFRDSKVYRSKDAALDKANKLLEALGYVEYGIQIVDTDYVFPGD